VLSARSRPLLLLSLCAGAAPLSYAQDLCLPPAPPVALPAPTEPRGARDQTVEISAGHVELETGAGAHFSDQVEIKYGDARITAERATIDELHQSIEALGRVTYTDPDVTIYGEDIQVDRERETVRLASAGFDLAVRSARGSAEQILIESDSRLSLRNVLFTTCPVGNNGWEITASDLILDPNTGLGTARGMKLDFKGVPIFYAPYFTFPIGNQRKSGFLTPDISERDRTGFDLSVPYYLNLAPNYDLTLEPRYMSTRSASIVAM
jgi:LPS-assembly protein